MRTWCRRFPAALAFWLVVGLVAVVFRANRTEGGPRPSIAGPVLARR
jgi:hypothetical protein